MDTNNCCRIIESDEKLSLEEIVRNEGAVIADTNIFLQQEFLESMYDFSSLIDINEKTIEEHSDYLLNISIPLLQGGVLVVPETLKEIKRGFDLINQMYQYRKKSTEDVIYRKKLKGERRVTKKREKLRHGFFDGDEIDEEKKYLEEVYNEFDGMLDLHYRMIELMSRPVNDATRDFNHDDLQEYSHLAQRLKRFKPKKKEPSWKKGNTHEDFGTDERIISASSILSRTSPVRILSRDPDIIGLLKALYFQEILKGFPVGEKIEIFSYFNQGNHFYRKATLNSEGISRYRFNSLV